jgi:hypothetical protein
MAGGQITQDAAAGKMFISKHDRFSDGYFKTMNSGEASTSSMAV